MARLQVEKRIEELREAKLALAEKDREKELWKMLKLVQAGEDNTQILDAVILGIHLLIEYFHHSVMNRRNAQALVNSTSERLDFLMRLDPKQVAPLQARFYLIRSKIETRHGNFWMAHLFSSFAFDLDKKTRPGGAANKLMAEGFHQLRFGFGIAAIGTFRKVMAQSNGAIRHTAQLMLGKSLRLSCCFDESQDEISNLLETEGLDAAVRIEAEWERISLKAIQTGDIRPLIKSASPDGGHYSASYLLEAKLWTYCSSDQSRVSMINKASYLFRNKSLGILSSSALYKGVIALEEAYDQSRPLSYRMEGMSRALERSAELGTVDQCQLFMIAAAHWFNSEKLYSSALSCVFRYQQISLSLTSSNDPDNLRIASALTDKSWFKNRVSSIATEECA